MCQFVGTLTELGAGPDCGIEMYYRAILAQLDAPPVSAAGVLLPGTPRLTANLSQGRNGCGVREAFHRVDAVKDGSREFQRDC